MCAAQVVCFIQGVQHTCGVSDRTVYKRRSLYKGKPELLSPVHSTQDGVRL